MMSFLYLYVFFKRRSVYEYCTLYPVYDVKTKQSKVENDVSLEYYFELHLYLTFLKIKKTFKYNLKSLKTFKLEENKSVFSYLRTLTTWHCPHSAAARRCCSNRSIPPRWAHSSKSAAAGLLLCAHAGTDSQTDTLPFHRPCSTYYASTANKK